MSSLILLTDRMLRNDSEPTTAANSIYCYERIITLGKFKRAGEEAGVIYFETLSQHSLGGNKGNHEKASLKIDVPATF
jgi:hypothetical protein